MSQEQPQPPFRLLAEAEFSDFRTANTAALLMRTAVSVVRLVDADGAVIREYEGGRRP